MKNLFICLLLFLMCGCEAKTPAKPKPFRLLDPARTLKVDENYYKWKTGNDQTVVIIDDDEIKDWLDNAQDKEIIDMTALTYGRAFADLGADSAYAETSSILIVYRQLQKSSFEK